MREHDLADTRVIFTNDLHEMIYAFRDAANMPHSRKEEIRLTPIGRQAGNERE
jgi:nitrogen fixation/metabolism regulation signal transduction histidine kinase